MSGCDGELAKVRVKVRALTEGGKLLVDKAITIPTNGFFELWLPRGRLVTLNIEA